MTALACKHEELFAVEWASSGNIAQEYLNAIPVAFLDQTDRQIESSTIALSQDEVVVDRFNELCKRADDIKLMAARVDKADLSNMLAKAFTIAERLSRPGDMIRAVDKLNMLYGLDPLTIATIARYENMNRTDETSKIDYQTLLSELAESLPD